MNGHTTNPLRSPGGLTVSLMLVLMLCLLANPIWSNDPGGKYVNTDERPLVQIRFDRWRSDLPPGVSLVVIGGGLINNGFPALSADGSQIAILYNANPSMLPGYPTLDLYSADTLVLQKRIELLPAVEAEQGPNLRDERMLTRIEGLLDDINGHLRQDGFRPIPQWYERHKDLSNEVDRFGKRLLSSWDESREESVFSITSRATGQLEYEMLMPQIDVSKSPYPDAPELGCTVSGVVEQVWYEQEHRILILRMILGGSRDGCELPDRWVLERL